MCLVEEAGESGVSVDVGDRRNAARALSRPNSVEARSVGGTSSEYVDETDGLRGTRADTIPRASSSSSSDSLSPSAYASPPNSDSSSSDGRPRTDGFTSS